MSVAYSRISQDFVKLRYIVELVRPGLVYARDGARSPRPWRRSISAAPSRRQHRSAGRTIRRSVQRSGCHAYRPRGRCRLCRDRPRHGRQDPLHVGLDGTAEGRRQHAAHAVRQPAEDRADLAVPPGARRSGRLAAVEPHLRRQPQFQPRPAPRRHALHRRRQARCRIWSSAASQPAPDLADALFQRAARLRHAVPASRARRRARREFLPRARSLVLRRGGAAADDLGAARAASAARRGERSRRWSPPGARPRPRRWRRPCISSIERAGNIGVPPPGAELLLVPHGDKLEMRVRGPHVMPGYFRRPDLTSAAFDEEGFFRTGDAGEVPRSRRAVERRRLRRAPRRELQALDRASGSMSGAVRVAAIAACSPIVARCRRRRARPRRDRRCSARLQSRGVPRASARS